MTLKDVPNYLRMSAYANEKADTSALLGVAGEIEAMLADENRWRNETCWTCAFAVEIADKDFRDCRRIPPVWGMLGCYAQVSAQCPACAEWREKRKEKADV